MRLHPHLYEINTWVWLGELSRKYHRPMCLGDVPAREWDDLESKGFDGVWLMGVWQRSEAGRKIALEDPQLRRAYDRALPDWQPPDIVGSPYAVRAYSPDPYIGTWQDLDAALEALHSRGMRLILDFVGNHTALDHAWVQVHPEYYVQGTVQNFKRSPADFFQVGRHNHSLYLAHGRDPYFPPWTDTVQLNYFNESTRAALLQELHFIAQHCDGVRCDMAMLALNRIFQKTWESSIGGNPEPATEFWREAVARLPGLIWIAEVYWDLEWEMQQLGFQFAYDKRLYDRLRHASAQDVSLHLTADVTYQSGLVRFLENHDEPRSAEVFSREQVLAFATLVATLPGMRLYHQGQFEGRRCRIPVQLGRKEEEPIQQEIMHLYEQLLVLTDEDVFHHGDWSRLSVLPAADSTCAGLIAYQWRLGRDWRIIVVNLSAQSLRGHLQVGNGLTGDSLSYEILDQLGHRRETIDHESLGRQGLPIDLGSYGVHLFSISVNGRDGEPESLR